MTYFHDDPQGAEPAREIAAPELRNIVRAVAMKKHGLRDNFYGERSNRIADAILAMPEMQAIRRLIKALGESSWDSEPQLDAAWDDLPMSVLIWAEEAQ